MSELEVHLLETLIKIRVQFLDGAVRIQNCLSIVHEVETKMENGTRLGKSLENSRKSL